MDLEYENVFGPSFAWINSPRGRNFSMTLESIKSTVWSCELLAKGITLVLKPKTNTEHASTWNLLGSGLL